ncbi:thiamine pyrophosphate-dependent enzyme [Streptomyces sp. NPDC050418]|uniref:thiamine pyrophosphate-dependent enzyme n=1 Tax=Streptomyces sp. NPDC050418 TaxID=3365612 RepID=UPI0037AE365D
MPYGVTATLGTDGRRLAQALDGQGEGATFEGRDADRDMDRDVDRDAQLAYAFGRAHFTPTPPADDQGTAHDVDPVAVESLAHLLAHAEQPVIVLSPQVWTARATDAAIDLIRTVGLPAYADGAGRGTLPPGDPYLFQHSRAYAFAGADVILVVGAPLGMNDFRVRDFRAGYGRRLAPHATVVQVDPGTAGSALRALAQSAARRAGDPRADRAAARREAWRDELRTAERTAESLWLRHLASDASPVHPFRLLAEIDQFLTEESVFIADDPWSAELAGRLVQPKTPGHWMDPGPLGTSGVGIPFALAAQHGGTDRECVVLLRDAPSTTATRGLPALVRHHLPVIGVVAHTGSAPFVHHARALGGHGEDVRDPAALRPALDRARATGGPALVGVRIDPDAYLPGSVNQPTYESEPSDKPHQTDELRNQ